MFGDRGQETLQLRLILKEKQEGKRQIPKVRSLFSCRFADFVEGSFHLTPNEVSVHEQEYGLGSIIAQDDEASSEEDEEMEENARPQWSTLTQGSSLT